jgi:hypothetical protein
MAVVSSAARDWYGEETGAAFGQGLVVYKHSRAYVGKNTLSVFLK